MNIATEAVSEVPGIQGGPYERRPIEFFGICNIILRNSLPRVFVVAEHEYRECNGPRGT